MSAPDSTPATKDPQAARITQATRWLANTGWKLLVPLIALALVAGHLALPKLQIDGITLGLLVIAAVPWFASFLTSFKAPGGWEFDFRILKNEQRELAINQRDQKDEIDTLKFLVTYLITEPEVKHLTKVSSDQPFMYTSDALFSRFLDDLRHLLNLGFIARAPNQHFSDFERKAGATGTSRQPIDVKSYFAVTPAGQTYLTIRRQAQQTPAAVAATATPQVAASAVSAVAPPSAVE